MVSGFQPFTYLCPFYMYFYLYTIFGIGIRFYLYSPVLQSFIFIFLVWHDVCTIRDVSEVFETIVLYIVLYMIPEFRDSPSPSYMMLKAAMEKHRCESALKST
jgi:hypothetical protein